MSIKKGSQEAVNAGIKAAATRKANKIKNGWQPKEKAVKVSKVHKPKIKIVPINLTKIKDTEEYIMYTSGPTKISYSSKYNTLRISPHTITLTSKS